jgi:NADPH-dependent 7-cyano-7-deazaguanine reductase QueF-like protein
MGGLSSAILSKMYIQNYETNNIINKKIFKLYIKAYYRYFDVIF